MVKCSVFCYFGKLAKSLVETFPATTIQKKVLFIMQCENEITLMLLILIMSKRVLLFFCLRFIKIKGRLKSDYGISFHMRTL